MEPLGAMKLVYNGVVMLCCTGVQNQGRILEEHRIYSGQKHGATPGLRTWSCTARTSPRAEGAQVTPTL